MLGRWDGASAEGGAMRRYLIVAHKTLGGAHLMEHVHKLRMEDPYCRFHVVVPVQHPTDHFWTEGEVRAQAQERLEEMLANMASMGMGAEGEVGDANPVDAVRAVIWREGTDSFTGIIVSTLPQSTSRWWRLNVPKRIAKAHPDLKVVHLVAEEALV